MKIVIAIDNDVISDVYSLALETCLADCQTISADSFSSAATAVGMGEVSVVIASASLKGEAAGALLASPEFVAAKPPLLLVAETPLTGIPADLRVTYASPTESVKAVLERVEGLLGLSTTREAYCRIAIKTLLLKKEQCQYDLYLRLADQKYVKVQHKTDVFDEEQYARFEKKQITHLYLTREDFLELMTSLLAMVDKLNANPEKITLDESINAVKSIFASIHSAFETEGFTPEMHKLTEATVGLAINTMKTVPRLGEMLKRIESNQDDFIGWHSTALSFLTCKLASSVGWTSEPTFYKLSLASLMHDISLQREDLALIQESAQLEAAKLSEADEELVLGHPLASARVVAKFPEVPGEVGFIIEHHHERPDGTGFPREIDHQDISAISALFIITHDLVNEMWKTKDQDFDFGKFLAQRNAEQRYTRGTFGQLFKAIMASAKAES